MGKMRILIADDEVGIRESLTLILGDEYELVFAEDGEQALTKIKNDALDLVLLDIKMPKLDGIEVLKQAKNSGATVPVLMLTAYQSVELAKAAIHLGALDYLPKPFDRDHILTTIRGVLARRGSPTR